MTHCSDAVEGSTLFRDRFDDPFFRSAFRFFDLGCDESDSSLSADSDSLLQSVSCCSLFFAFSLSLALCDAGSLLGGGRLRFGFRTTSKHSISDSLSVFSLSSFCANCDVISSITATIRFRMSNACFGSIWKRGKRLFKDPRVEYFLSNTNRSLFWMKISAYRRRKMPQST